MSIIRISSTKSTPAERKGLELRERRLDEATLQMATAGNILKQAHGAYAAARREYKRALNDLVTYRERIEPRK